ncbi:MAG: electron transfer flavoprotein subunit alpha/FixB family protein [Anaerolineae bacterium]|nr:MAG: electron transfer flavoprotein subunit alpha/FixB family protein [Anaerolineae bacterium]
MTERVESLYGIDEESKAIWVFLGQIGGNLEPVSLELLTHGRQLADQAGWTLVGLLLGHEVGHLTEQAIAHGADEVWLADHPLLEEYTIDTYGRVVFDAIMEGKPSAFIAGATPNGRDLLGRLAVRLRAGLTADCTDLKLVTETGILISEVTGFGGGVLALIEAPTHRPQMATVRPGVFPLSEADASRKGRIIDFQVLLSEDMLKTEVVETVVGAGVDLTQAEMLVIGGRGIEGDFEMLRELADALGGDIGATRPPVDDGFIKRERQIGQTGVVCRPKVAIVCGVSGAFHFAVGIQDAETVIAINTDPEAPMFEFADYCIVGDAAQIVPALTHALTLEKVPSV